MSQPKRHHYIPRFFFEPWHCDDNKNVWVYERKDGKVKGPYPQSTKSICCENNLYTMSDKIEQESRTDLETKFLSNLDNYAARILQKIIDNNRIDIISDEEMEKLSIFLISIRTRTPEYFRYIIASLRDRFFDILKEISPEKINDNDTQKFLENIGYEQYSKDIQKPALIDKFMNMTWLLFNTENNNNILVTSDRPLIFYQPLNSEEFTLSISITPNKLLFATNNNQALEDLTTMRYPNFIEIQNTLTINQAQSKAFCHDRSIHSIEFFEDNLCINLNPSMVRF